LQDDPAAETTAEGRCAVSVRRGAAILRGLVLGGFCAGCAGTSAEGSFRDVAALVEARSGQKIAWDQGGPADQAVEQRIAVLLKNELSADQAVQIALLRNRSLQGIYEELSVAQADLVQAGLLKNPALGASLTFPLGGGPGAHLEMGVVQSFLDLFLIPARKTLAGAELEHAKLKVGTAALDLAADVRSAYYTLQGAQQILALRRVIVEAASASAELAKRQNEAGNLSELDLVNEQGQAEQVELDAARSEADVMAARERLTRLMGLWGPQVSWTITAQLPPLPKAEPPLAHLESLAIAQRLDIAAARQEMQVAAYAFSIADTSFIREVGAGADLEVESGHGPAAGPALELELPIFDQGRAESARKAALFRQSRHRLAQLAIEARSQVREARSRLLATRAVVERYRDVLIPIRERIVALSQQKYNAMLMGVYELLLAKQSEVNTYREYIEAVRDYWIARSDLERAAGGRLSSVAAAAPGQSPGTSVKPPSPPDDPLFRSRK
jgi:outer membrane protein, heavy metal efflux system